MAHIAIVTDSSANLLPEFIAFHHIRVIPFKIHFWGETLRDGIDITPNDFYKRLAKTEVIPIISQPSSQEFLQVFEELAPQCDGIIVPLISSGISGTVSSAWDATARFSAVPVEIVDSHSTAAGLALVVIAAAQAVEAGKSLTEIYTITEDIARQTQLFIMVDTLKYLHRGGRIYGTSSFLDSVLSIKPILYLDEKGKINALERVWTKRKAMSKLVQLAAEKANGKPANVGIIHANAHDLAKQLWQQIVNKIKCYQVEIYELSPVIGTHIGPGAVGVAIYPVME
jgi:DegV family protein with EDD domain